MTRLIYIFCLTLLAVTSSSCKKYLEEKNDKKLSTPSTLDDLQALMDAADLSRATVINNSSSDEYYMTTSDFNTLGNFDREQYTWDLKEDTYFESSYDWTYQYRNIFTINTVLDNLKNIPAGDEPNRWNAIKGGALFMRAYYFWTLAQIYAKPYNAATADTDPGICLRLSSDFNKRSIRASISETYNQIIQDLTQALELLPDMPAYKSRPGRAAALALFARIYLCQQRFEEVRIYADSSLRIYDSLMDYNSIPNISSSYAPFPRLGREVIFNMMERGNALTAYFGMARIDSNLYSSFAGNDLRKAAFFTEPASDGSVFFKGSYSGLYYYPFNGIATDEVYLMRAESHARLGNTNLALMDLNRILINRYFGTFTPLTAASAEEALNLVLIERRKELVYRGLRWMDIRRLNLEPSRAITLKRVIGANTYTLLPNDLRYVMQIPKKIIEMTGIPQNPR